MLIPFLLLCFQTLFFWGLAIIFYRKKNTITLIPLYAYIAILTLLTHNLSDLGFAVVVDSWFFLISSFSLFTTLMFSTLFLYLLEGPRAGRLALWIILFFSFFYIALVYLLNFEVDTSTWVQLTPERLLYYFWSMSAIVVDVLFLAIVWELLSRIRSLPLFIRVFVTTMSVFLVDTLIFTTGVFGFSDAYISILGGNVLTRFILSLIGTPIITFFLKKEGFAEEKREKPNSVWEILNFRSDLENKVLTLEELVEKYKVLEKKLKDSEETYRLAISGVGAGIWDWDIITDSILWSQKCYSLLGYDEDTLGKNLTSFKKMIHPDDKKRVFGLLDTCFSQKKLFETEYRIRRQDGTYRWFLVTGVVKYDTKDKPIRMVGSLIDIQQRKQDEIALADQVEELKKVNTLMVGRELKMKELKQANDQLKKKLK